MPDPTKPNDQTLNPPTGQPVNQSSVPPLTSAPSDLPPIPDFQNVGPVEPTNQPTVDSGSAAPSDIPPVVSPPPKKKFGTGRIIATILGILLLVGGVGAGLVLTQQQQLFQQKAAGCPSGYYSCNKPGGCCQVFTGNPLPSGGGTGGASGTSNLGGGLTGATGTAGGTSSPNPLAGVSGTAGGITPQPSPLGGVTGTAGGKTPTPGPLAGVIGTAGGRTPTPEPLSGVTGTAGGTGPFANVTGTAGGIGTCSPSGGKNGGCPSGQACSCPGGTNCKCGALPSNQDPCYHTICPVQYTCVGSGSGAFCQYSGGGGGGGGGGAPTAVCSTVLAYDANYSPMTSSQLSAVTSGTTINFCVGGSASSGSFDKAKFTINGVAQAETTTHRPGSTDFCQSYQIPSGISSFNVKAQIHHATLGWSI